MVMTKFIEGAREIEMDAVAQHGKVCGNFLEYFCILTRILNAFSPVHVGDKCFHQELRS